MKTIYKYRLNVGLNTISLPAHAEILSFQNQREELFIWCLVDTSSLLVNKQFRIVGTGQELNEPGFQYIGTAQTEKGMFVWHAFQILS